MEPDWLENRPQDGLKYPYTLSERIPKKYTDPHGRHIYSLLASLSCFGHRLMLNPASPAMTSDNAHTFIPVVTRFFENASQGDDFRILFENISPTETKSRIIFLSTVLQNNAVELITRTNHLTVYEHIIFVHSDDNDAYSIYFFVPSQRTLDLYLIGQNNMETVTRICNTIHGWYILSEQFERITIRHRFQTPSSFPYNPTVFAFILAMTLHAHADYLNFNIENIGIQAVMLFPQMIELHDASFGHIDSGSLNRRSHPFFVAFNPKQDDPHELQSLGWSVIDVIGDGNCGYYCTFLGLENLGITTYSPNIRSTYPQPMKRCMPWQFSVMRLRRELKTKSTSLIEIIFTDSNANLPWRPEICPLAEEAVFLSDEFLCDTMAQADYFDYSLVNDEERKPYMLSSFWGYIVAASFLKIRFIVYMRMSQWDGSKVNYIWSTVTIDPFGELVGLFNAREGLHKISDHEFRNMPTIEVMYTSGTEAGRKLVDKHYRFLRRVLCDDYTNKLKVNTTNDSLRSFIQHEIDT